jgi:methionyl-tRNA formyltransferase
MENKFAFFGTDDFSVGVLNGLLARGFLPALIVATEDAPKGRSLVLTPPETKVWAEEHGIPCIQPKKLVDARKDLEGFDLFVVASYGKIIPQEILDLPQKGVLNVHPSLLPKLRGSSPIQSAILSEDKTGVTIIKLDKEVDHGPILAQKEVSVPEWPPYEKDLRDLLAREGGELLADVLSLENVEETEQDHASATFTKKIEKKDGELNLEDSPEINLRKIRAYHVWPGAYFFIEHAGKQIRVIVKRAHIEDGKLILDRIIPEGKKEMDYKDFLRGLKTGNQ